MAFQPRYPQAVPLDPRSSFEPVDLAQLGQALNVTFVELATDDEQRAFVEQSQARPHSWFRTVTHRVVRTFISDYDANGLLGMYPMHLLSTRQWRTLLRSDQRQSLLDVGAGDGGLTRHLAPLFTSITTTETSKAMARRLRQRGYACLERDVSEVALNTTYDCVTCLNVVDRTPRPRQLLAQLARLVEPGGVLVLATPLPIRAFYYRGPQTLEPTERLSASGPTWERAATQFVASVAEVAPALALQAWTKAAYLSWGDHAHRLYSLDDFVGVWQRPASNQSDH